MQKYRDNITIQGRGGLVPVRNARVTVYKNGTNDLATIYTDAQKSRKGNPFNSDALGGVFFYAENGRYDLLIQGEGQDLRLNDLLMEDVWEDVDELEIQVPAVAQTANAAAQFNQDLQSDSDPGKGATLVGYHPGFSGGVDSEVKGFLDRGVLTAKHFGAIMDGEVHPLSERFATIEQAQVHYPTVPIDSLDATIDWAAIQAGINSGRSIWVNEGIAEINRPLVFSCKANFSGRGTKLFGFGRRKTTIRNSTTSSPLIEFGDIANNWDAIDCALIGLSLEGNGGTVPDVLSVLGDDDDGLTQASRSVTVDEVRISNAPQANAIRLSAWAFNGGFIEVQNCLRGVNIGQHVYSAKFSKFYNVSAIAEAIYIDDTVPGSKAAQILFENPVLQGCGATGQAVYLGGATGVSIRNAYVENLHADATAVFRIGSGNRSSELCGLFYTRGSGPTALDVIDTASPSFLAVNLDVRGDARSFVKITGANPGTTIVGAEQPSGVLSFGAIDDQSTNKRTIYLNTKTPAEARQTPTGFWAATTEAAVRWIDRATGAIQGFVKNGRLHLGADDSSVNLQAVGSTLNMYNGSGGSYATARAEQFRLGTSNAKFVYYTSNPEGAITADPGSLCAVVSGGAAGLWAKASGTDATGWQKLTP